MTSLLPLAITLGLLIAGGAAWFAALVVTRRERGSIGNTRWPDAQAVLSRRQITLGVYGA